jgi:hypothetical protein
MKIINTFNSKYTTSNTEQEEMLKCIAKKIISVFIEFHYIMVYLFGAIHDTENIDFTNYSNYTYFNNTYLYKLLKKTNTIKEIQDYYNSKTYFFNDDTLPIDNLLNIKNNGIFIEKDIIKKIDFKNPFTNLYNYLEETVDDIRFFRYKEAEFKEIGNKINFNLASIFKTITDNITLESSIMELFFSRRKNEISNILNTLKDIIMINLLILVIIYSKDNQEKIETTKINYLVFINYDNDDVSNKECQTYHNTSLYNKFPFNEIYGIYNPYHINNLNKHEMINISKYIADDIFSLIKTQFDISLNFCKFIFKESKDIDLKTVKESENTNLKTFEHFINVSYHTESCIVCKTSYDDCFKDENQLKIADIKNMKKYDSLIYNYTNIVKIINNKYNSKKVIQKFTQKKLQIVNLVKKYMKQIIILEQSSDILNNWSYTIPHDLIFIASDGKYLISNGNIRISSMLDYFYFLQDKTNIYIVKKSVYNSPKKIIDVYSKIINNDLWESEDFINCFDFTENKYLESYGFTFFNETNYKYNSCYYSLLNMTNGEQTPTNLSCIISRFGVDINKTQILLDYNSLDINTTEEHKYIFGIKDSHKNPYKCFVILAEYNKCLEITFTKDNLVDINNCYIFEKRNYDIKYKLLLNLKTSLQPFLKLIPLCSPYLCYFKNNAYHIDIISTSKFKKSKIMYNPVQKMEENDFMIELKVAPSLIFLTGSINVENYKNIFEINDEDIKNINISAKNDLMKNDFIIDEPELLGSLLWIEKKTNKMIEKSRSTIELNDENISQFTKVLKDYEKSASQDNSPIIDEFIQENKLCTKYKNKFCEINIHCDLYLKNIEDKINHIIESLSNELDFGNYVFNNLKKFLVIMCLNIFKQTIIDSESVDSCWDVQDVISKLNTIITIIDYCKKQSFYNYEIIFLLQSEYFYKKNQLEKYFAIRQDLNELKNKLKLHQFMMGKGKTSVFTPLLSFGIKFKHDKQPTIITAEHLVLDTKDKVKFTELITSIKINVFSDFEAKKRWIENTDLYLLKDINKVKIDLKNECNIIDEFDSHHNYLQSMFNFVIKNKEIIDKTKFNYIFDYIYSYLYGGTPPTRLPENNLLEKNLIYFINISNNMIYNKNYGFSFFKFTEELSKTERLCSPFTRKDTPIKNASFSSILLTIILTIKTYLIEFKQKLQDFDFSNLAENLYLLDEIIHYEKSSYEFEIIGTTDRIKIIADIFNETYKLNDNNKNKEILKKYLFIINQKKLNVASIQVNMSFQDIIYNVYNQWQVGYSGTTTLKLNDYRKEDTHVFREIIGDYDFKIEIKLALLKYGNNQIINSMEEIKVLLINKEDDYKHNLAKIVCYIGGSRGIVDLAGLFLNYKNKEIAKELKNLLKDKKIIYLSDKDEKLEFVNEFEKIKFSEIISDNNFYYYDQCHTVGTDIKQPRTGHVIIIIDENTRMTDFAQAIFRFRKINRGTYLSIAFIKSTNVVIHNNQDIYNLLETNEQKFNEQQLNGIKYQFLKALVRKNTKKYIEDDILPEFVRGNIFNRPAIIEYIASNIKELYTNICTDDFIKNIHSNILSLKDEKLKTLVLGSGNETQINVQQEEEVDEKEEEVDEQTQEEQKIREIIEPSISKEISKYLFKEHFVIRHLNCIQCINLNCVRMFDKDDEDVKVKINNKDIYISYNFLNENLVNATTKCRLDKENFNNIPELNDRLCFVELNDKILIELESVGFDYYIDKLPVYDYNGKIIDPNMANIFNKYPYVLDIDDIFVKLIGMKNYFNPNNDNPQLKLNKKDLDVVMKKIVNNIFSVANLALSAYFLYCSYKSRHNISYELYMSIINIGANMSKYLDYRESIYFKEHNKNPIDNIQNVSFGINLAGQHSKNSLNPLVLTITGYGCKPITLPFRQYYYFTYLRKYRNINKLFYFEYKDGDEFEDGDEDVGENWDKDVGEDEDWGEVEDGDDQDEDEKKNYKYANIFFEEDYNDFYEDIDGNIIKDADDDEIFYDYDDDSYGGGNVAENFFKNKYIKYKIKYLKLKKS